MSIDRNPYAPPRVEVMEEIRDRRSLGHRIVYGLLALEILLPSAVYFILFAPGLFFQMQMGSISRLSFATDLSREALQLGAGVSLSLRADRIKAWPALGVFLLMVCRLQLNLHSFLHLHLLPLWLANLGSLCLLLPIVGYALLVARD